jgi:hypothetical protein
MYIAVLGLSSTGPYLSHSWSTYSDDHSRLSGPMDNRLGRA